VTTQSAAAGVNSRPTGCVAKTPARPPVFLAKERTMRFDLSDKPLPCAALLAFGFSLAAGAALAAGSSPPDTPTCSRGEVYNSSTKKCERQQAGVLPDQDLANYAYALAKAKRYDEAIAVLNLMKNPNTAQALNYRGYATRHMGKLDEGIQYYLRSVKLDPHYAQVREYLGEAYVIKGDLASARYQLRQIKTICGNSECEEYEDLEKAIAGHPEEG
jgi:tetratricopeptide (TPR) repeat protein